LKAKLFFIAVLFFSTSQLCANVDKSTSYKVDPSESNIEWTGKKVAGAHFGNINIKEGHLLYEGNTITGGSFSIDMNSITCTDLTDERSNSRLVNHLKSDDFFGTSDHPVSILVIKMASQKSGDQYEITGDLTIKGITHEIVFPATVQFADDKLTALADITVDRTKYDIKFRSGRFFDSLGDRLIYDDFTLKVELVASQDVL
jgi:polyisoprenoid-binding protein YceI